MGYHKIGPDLVTEQQPQQQRVNNDYFFQAMQQPVAGDRKMVLMTCLCLKLYQGFLIFLE